MRRSFVPLSLVAIGVLVPAAFLVACGSSLLKSKSSEKTPAGVEPPGQFANCGFFAQPAEVAAGAEAKILPPKDFDWTKVISLQVDGVATTKEALAKLSFQPKASERHVVSLTKQGDKVESCNVTTKVKNPSVAEVGCELAANPSTVAAGEQVTLLLQVKGSSPVSKTFIAGVDLQSSIGGSTKVFAQKDTVYVGKVVNSDGTSMSYCSVAVKITPAVPGGQCTLARTSDEYAALSKENTEAQARNETARKQAFAEAMAKKNLADVPEAKEAKVLPGFFLSADTPAGKDALCALVDAGWSTAKGCEVARNEVTSDPLGAAGGTLFLVKESAAAAAKMAWILSYQMYEMVGYPAEHWQVGKKADGMLTLLKGKGKVNSLSDVVVRQCKCTYDRGSGAITKDSAKFAPPGRKALVIPTSTTTRPELFTYEFSQEVHTFKETIVEPEAGNPLPTCQYSSEMST